VSPENITLAEVEARLAAARSQEQQIMLQLAGKVELDLSDLEQRINELPHTYQSAIAAMVLLTRRQAALPTGCDISTDSGVGS
jgi:hypothetical protein